MPLIHYELDGSIATITLDDGKANVLSTAMLGELGDAFRRAAADRAVVVLTGRDGIFSGGFDLAALTAGGFGAFTMVRAGFELAAQVLSHPFPVVVASPGHAIAMGSFLLLSGDHRIGVAGPYRYVANEVAIGLTMPHAAVAILRHRLSPAAFDRAVALAEVFDPETAVPAGFLDEVVEPEELEVAARKVAERLATLDMAAHAGSKLRARAGVLQAVRDGIAADVEDVTAALA